MSFCRFVNDLPPDILIDILSRLPTKNIIRCRCVCKTWLSHLLDPNFANTHLTRSPTTLVIHQLDRRPHFPCGDYGFLKLVEFDHDHRRLRCDPAMKFDLESACYPNGQILLVGSVNGLLCICDYENEAVHITNPIMREYVTLPKPKYSRGGSRETAVYGFGFGSISGCYKVVHIVERPVSVPASAEPHQHETRVEVYTLGTGRWRNIDIGASAVSISYICRSNSVFLNGKIHWLVYADDHVDRHDTINSFDIGKELLQSVSTPPSKGTICKSLGLFEAGCLCVSDNSSESDLVIWVMKEYGVEESWTKQLVIRKSSSDNLTHFLSNAVVSPLKVWENGDYLILYRDDYLYNYSPEREALEEVRLPRDKHACEMMFHVASFCSLKDLVTTEIVNRF